MTVTAPDAETVAITTEVTAMQNFFANSALVQIRMQERLSEAEAAELAARARGNRAGRFGRFGAALRNIFENAPESEFDFVPRLVDYPAHAA